MANQPPACAAEAVGTEPSAASDVRVLVQEEGRAARNLLVFNVLVDNKSPSAVLRSACRQPAGPSRAGRPGPPEERVPARAAAAAARKRGRARSVSAGRGSAKDLHARYWTFLFENLRRAVDEIYQTCETDDSVLECKETIMILERCTQDFRNLIEWLKIKWEYDHTPKPQRPASVAWEIRKTSPGKLPLALVERRLIGDLGRKQLAFEERPARPESVSSGSLRAEQEAAAGRYLEQALRAATESLETAESPQPPPPPPPPPPEEDQPAARPARSPPQPAPEPGQKTVRVRTATRPRGGRAAARAGASPRGGGRGGVARSGSDGAVRKPEQRMQVRQTAGQLVGRGSGSGSAPRPDRGGLTSRRPARGGRPAGPPSVPRPERRPAPAQLYSSCVASRSNSSLSSTASSSGQSWADRVRGVPASPAAAPAAPTAAPAAAPADPAFSTAAPPAGSTPPTDDDGGGWETVKSRSRSRLSSLNHGQARAPLQRKGSAEAACGGGRQYSARARFHQPTSAVSLPSLAPCSSSPGGERRPSGVSERAVRGAARRAAGRSVPPPPEQRDSQALRRSRERVPAQGESQALRRSRERVPAQGESQALRRSRERVPGQMTGQAVTETGRKGRAAGETCTERGTKSGSSDSVVRSGAPQRSSDISASSPDTLQATLPTAPPTTISSTAATTANVNTDTTTTATSTTSTATTTNTNTVTTTNATTAAANSADSSTAASATDAALSVSPSAGAAVCSASAAAADPDGSPTTSQPPRDLTSPTPAPRDLRSPAPALLDLTSSTATPRDLISPIPIPRDLPSPTPTPRDLSSPTPTPRDLSSPTPTPRDLPSSELDEDSVDEEMVQAERALQSAIVEERHLEQQLAETESCVIEVDTETDGDSTSIDTECEGDGGPVIPPSRSLIEDQYAPELENLSWGDRMELLEELEDLSSRPPGRGLQMHEKLSSPSRKKALSETIRLHQERQQKASRMRRSLMDQKTQKLSEISIKIEEVRQQKDRLLEQRRLMLERKMARAEEKRRKHLQDIVRRAHDEEEKAKEIAFINELEAKNKRHEFYSQIQTQEARLAGIQEERQRRLEEKAAKEAAAEEKRRALEQERQVKLQELRQKRQERLERIHREQQDKEKERQEMAREKQRDRDERLSALHAAQQATTEELQRRIQQKQEESARRHEENMVQIRQRALELSVRSAASGADDAAAQLAPYDTKKMCTLCNVLIGSEVYLLTHLRGRQHQEAVSAAAGSDLAGEELLLYNLRHITDAAPHQIISMTFDKERHKALRKRCKKIKARMVARQQEYRSSRQKPAPVESPHRAKLVKCVKDLNKVVSGQGRGPWPNPAVSALDRTLGELMRILDKGVVADQLALCAAGGLQALSDIITHIQEELARDVEIVPARTVSNVSRALAAACLRNPDNCLHLINSNMVGGALDLLMTRLTRLSSTCASSGGMRCDPGAAALMQVTSAALAALTSSQLSHQRWSLLQDVCSYLVCVGTVDKISSFFSCVQGGPDSEPHLADFLTQSLRLLRAMAALLTARHPQSTQSKEPLDRTGLIATLQVTQLCGIVSLLYGALLRHHSPAQRRSTPPPPLDQATVLLAEEALATLIQLARLDLHMFQMCLGFEGRSVEFRHVTSYLLWYCCHHEQPSLLGLVIQATGYFAARCYDNQMVIQKGNMPTVLQQLLTLPFAHFSDPALTAVLFPTLLACCLENAQTRAILERELSYQILEDFLKQESSRSCHLVRVLLAADEESSSVRSGSVASSS